MFASRQNDALTLTEYVVAVAQRIPLRAVAVLDVLESEVVFLLVLEIHAQAEVLAAPVELAVDRNPFTSWAHADRGLTVNPRIHEVGVGELAAQAIAPGEGGHEAVVLAPGLIGRVERRASAGDGIVDRAVARVLRDAEDEAAAIAKPRLETAGPGPRHFARRGERLGAEHVGEGLDRVDLELALVGIGPALKLAADRCGDDRGPIGPQNCDGILPAGPYSSAATRSPG